MVLFIEAPPQTDEVYGGQNAKSSPVFGRASEKKIRLTTGPKPAPRRVPAFCHAGRSTIVVAKCLPGPRPPPGGLLQANRGSTYYQ